MKCSQLRLWSILIAICAQTACSGLDISIQIATPGAAGTVITETATITTSPTVTATSTSTSTLTATASATPTASPLPRQLQPAAPSPTATPSPTPCGYKWLMTMPPGSPVCPSEAGLRTYAAVQHFQQGIMIWLKVPGLYYILWEGTSGEGFAQVTDPLNLYRDTSAQYKAPAGLFAPVSGFGLVWRGDVFAQEGQGYLGKLGWATIAEAGYDAIYQCQYGPTPHWTCYVTMPGGVIGMSSVGTWFYQR